MRIFGFVLAAGALLAPAVFGQGESAPRVQMQITKYRVKPGQVPEFEDVIKKYSAVWKKEGRDFFMVWRTSMGDQYEFISMLHMPAGFGAFDGPAPTAKALGEGPAANLANRMAQCLDGVTRQWWHMHPELSIWSEQNFRAARVVELSLRNSAATPEHSRTIAKTLPGMKNADRKNYWVMHLDYGGDTYRALLFTPVEKYADLETPLSLTKLVGADEAKKIIAVREQTVVAQHDYVWAYRPDLSFRKAELSAK